MTRFRDDAERHAGMIPNRVPGRAHELSFLERLKLLADQRWNWRENHHSPGASRMPSCASQALALKRSIIEPRGLDKSVIRFLMQQSVWVWTHENIFVLGPTGVGKSFVACALTGEACRDGYSALYTRAQSLFRDLAMARADGSCVVS